MVEGLGEAALAHRLDVGAGGEDLVGAGDHDAADLGVGVESLELGRELSIISGESALRASGRFSRSRATWPSSEVSTSSVKPYSASIGIIALIPVAARPMISFWICDVPS